MKRVLSLILFVAVVPVFAVKVAAQSSADQDNYSAAQSVEDLKLQLLDVQAREAELQAHARQLDEALKPENIERSLAGVGSTRPEELREQVRRQLTIERDGVTAQLKLVTTSRERLETVLRTAEAQAYQQSAEQAAFGKTFIGQYMVGTRRVIAGLAGLVAILGIAFVVILIRRTRMA